MSFMLKMENDNYEVISAGNAAEALRRLENDPFGIYILDSLLPDMSGIDLCARIRRTDGQTPILFYSGRAEHHYIAKAKAAGATEYLIKPNDLNRFTEVIRKHLI
jgi:DNA-binding response OmpR family regulator